MTPVADPFMTDVRPSGLQKGRGGFLRSADDAPYISDPTGALVKSGERQGEVCRLKYGSPSNRGREIENDAGLVKYKQRLTLLGIGMEPSLATACSHLADYTIGSPEFNTAADTIVVCADRLTRSSLAADRGTHGHLLTEMWDRRKGKSLSLNPPTIEAGRAVGLDEATQGAVLDAWHDMLKANGLEILAIEASCVDDTWRLAGTLDRIVRLTGALSFAKSSGEIVTIPAGTVLILDIKFGKCRKAHPIQIASYAQSRPYDTETEERGMWPWIIDQDHALIAHGDFGDDSRPVSIELVWVDLSAGREHGGQCVVDAKAWAARDDVFSVARLDSSQVSPMTATTAGVGEPALAPAPSHLKLADARNLLATTPAQGADLTGSEFELLWAKIRHEYDTLPGEHRAWINAVSSEATQRNLTFHTRRCRTERSYHIAKALITTASGDGNPEIVRHLVASILGDVGYSEHVTVGWLVGSLTDKQAERFAVLADEWATSPAIA